MNHDVAFLSLSGGLDSSTLLFYLLHNGSKVSTVTFDYGQINKVETIARKKVLEIAKKKYPNQIIDDVLIDVSNIVAANQELTKKLQEEKGNIDNQCSFYFPNRNALFTNILANLAETYKLQNRNDNVVVALGLQKHSVYEDYWDSNIQFYERMREVFNLNPIGIDLIAPFVNDSKTEVLRKAVDLNVPVELTWSCYNPIIEDNVAKHCLKCDACRERIAAEEKLNLKLTHQLDVGDEG